MLFLFFFFFLRKSFGNLLLDNRQAEGTETFPGGARPLPDLSGVSYQGGRLLVDPISVYLIWLGPWPEKSKHAVRNSIRSLSSPSGSAWPDLYNWWRLAAQYTDKAGRSVSSNVSLGSSECWSSVSVNVTRELVTSVVLQSFNFTADKAQLAPTACSGVVPQDAAAVYHLLFSREVVFAENEFNACTRRLKQFQLNGNGPVLSFAWSREPRNFEYCNLWSFGDFLTPPNAADRRDKGQLDSLISFTLAQTVSVATNTDFSGWQTKFARPVTGMCLSPTGKTYSKMPILTDTENSVSWNLYGINGYRYVVQQIWNQRTGACALQPVERCKEHVALDAPSGTLSNGLIVNHNVGLQSVEPNVSCEWRVAIPKAVNIRFTVNYFDISRNNDRLDLFACRSGFNVTMASQVLDTRVDVSSQSCLYKQYRGLGSPHQLTLLSSSFSLNFTTGRSISHGTGWEIEYKAGYCEEKIRVIQPSGTLTDGTPPGESHLEDNTCQWLLDAKPGTPVKLNFTRFNTVTNKDNLTVFRGKDPIFTNVLEVYNGNYTVLPRDTFIGPVLLVFATATRSGGGWEANYTMDPRTERSRTDAAVIFAAVFGCLGGVIAAGLVIYVYFHKYVKHEDGGLTKPLLQKSHQVFSKSEIEQFTSQFSNANLIAEGSHAAVFQGVLPEGQKVAVKTSERQARIMNELTVLSDANHPSIIGLIGWCEDSDTYLVLEHVPNGPLSDHLFSSTADRVLSWEIRLRIAVQVSTALAYLHGYTQSCIAHGNVISENVLLDKAWNAKLAGFGSAASCSKVESRNFFKLRAEDVYRFGGLVLEMVIGERAWEGNSLSSRAAWGCRAIEEGNGMVALDKRCQGKVDLKAVLKMGEVAAWCMNRNVEERPTMVEVASALRQVLAISNVKRMSP